MKINKAPALRSAEKKNRNSVTTVQQHLQNSATTSEHYSYLTAVYLHLEEKGVNFGPDTNISSLLQEINEADLDTQHPFWPVTEAMIDCISHHFEAILKLMLIDIRDPNVKDTPRRLAKMYVNELFAGRYKARPAVTDFPKGVEGADDNMMCVGPLEIKSMCSHHWQPIVGHCWVAILPSNKLLGLSKFARIVDWVAARPTLQENMAELIANEIGVATMSSDIAVIVDAKHFCMTLRGAEEPHAITGTHVMRGGFRASEALRQEFLMFIQRNPAPTR